MNEKTLNKVRYFSNELDGKLEADDPEKISMVVITN